MARSAVTTKDAGFTLVELLVVVFIIGLMAGVVVVNLPRPAPPAETHARAVSRALHQATRESIIGGQALAWSAGPRGAFRLERYIAGQWEAFGRATDAPERDGTVLHIDVEYPEGGLRPDEPARDEDEGPGQIDARFVRRVVFSPVGEATPAQIRVRSANTEYAITVHGDGDVEWHGASGDRRRR